MRVHGRCLHSHGSARSVLKRVADPANAAQNLSNEQPGPEKCETGCVFMRKSARMSAADEARILRIPYGERSLRMDIYINGLI
jgi:hypothetical protein